MFSGQPSHWPPVEDRPTEAPPRIVVDPSVPMRACCCPAPPVVKVMMPPSHGRAYPVDLWLCGHHYHEARALLAAAGATVDEDLTLPANPACDDRATALTS